MNYKQPEQTLISTYLSCQCPCLVVEGPCSSGKSYTLQRCLQDTESLTIDCDYCLSRRRVLSKILEKVYELEKSEQPLDRAAKHCENMSNFVYTLRRVMTKPQRVVLVLERLDRMVSTEQPEEICAGLAKLHEQSELFAQFTFVFVVNRADYLDASTMSLPTVQFHPYTDNQIKTILGGSFVDREWLELVIQELGSSRVSVVQLHAFVKTYVEFMVDTYGSYFGGNIESMVPVLRKLWPVFYEPVKKKGYIRARENDVLATFTKNKRLLQTETGLVNPLQNPEDETTDYDIGIKTKYLVVASYLASFTDPKNDMVNFSKNRQIRSNRKVRYGRKKKVENLAKTMTAQPFTLERMLAILRSIYDEFDRRETFENDVELMTEMATLASLKTLVKLSAGDTIGGGTRWRSNVQWSVVKKFSEDIGFQIENYL